MNKNLLVWRLLVGKRLQNGVVTIIMALGVALAVLVMLLSEGVHDGMVQAAKPFPLLMGAKGSPNQLILNSIFLKDQPIGNISYAEVERLRQEKTVEQAIPLGFGDNYRGFRLIGTEKELFNLKLLGAKQESWLQFAQGRAFSQENEAVLGAEAARLSGLKLGDTFSSVHGLVANANSKAHAEKYKVVGILKPVHGPYDQGIFVTMESIWEHHKHGQQESTKNIDKAIHEATDKDVTAVIIRPMGYAASMQLVASYSKNSAVQIVFPAKIVIQLFSILGNVEKIFRLLNMAVLAMALLIIAGSLYWLSLCSAHQQAIMQAFGATTGQVLGLYFRLGMCLVGTGVALGMALGHSIYFGLSRLLQHNAGLYLPQQFLPEEGVLVMAILLLGAICSWLPAYWTASHSDIVENL
ncbi:MAG: ABC transporter permease [Phascolarctobacterium sp.]